MPFKQKYSKEQKDRAVELAREVGVPKASEETEIAINYLRTLIHRRRKKLKDGHERMESRKTEDKSDDVAPKVLADVDEKEKAARGVIAGSAYQVAGEEIEKIFAENKEEVEAIVKDALKDSTIEMQEKLQSMIILATDTAIDSIKKGPGPKESKSQWLRAVIGAIAQGVEKYQLIAGKPTERHEQQGQVTERHEHEVIHRVEEYTDIYSKLAERTSGLLQGSDESDDLGESMDTDTADSQTS